MVSAGFAEAQYLQLAEDLPGEATDVGHEDWIEITGYVLKGPDGGGKETSFSLQKAIDRSSPLLLEACLTGRRFDGAVLEWMLPDDEKSVFCRLEMDGVFVTAVRPSAMGDDAFSEEVAFAVTRLTYRYRADSKDEVEVSLDGISQDGDDDGMADAWELEYGLDLESDDGALDLDHDGQSNLSEFLAGTDPTSGSSFFKVEIEIDPEAPEQWRLRWNSQEGVSYRILWSPDLLTPFVELQQVVGEAESTQKEVMRQASLGFFKVERLP
nr:type VI secretion system tube protein Hcp [Haloferula luteola]